MIYNTCLGVNGELLGLQGNEPNVSGPVDIKQLVAVEMEYTALVQSLSAHPPSFTIVTSLEQAVTQLANTSMAAIVNAWHDFG